MGALALGLAVGHAGASLVYRDGAASAYAAPGRQGGAVGGAASLTSRKGDGD